MTVTTLYELNVTGMGIVGGMLGLHKSGGKADDTGTASDIRQCYLRWQLGTKDGTNQRQIRLNELIR